MKYFIYARKSTEEDDRQLLSIDAQLRELREYVQKESLCVVREFVESRTAKVPGRPVFNAMIEKIEQGHAQGIIAWHPDRLARNSVDGGRLVYALDTGALIDLRFPQFLFENNPHGKFVLTLAFGQSKYFVDQLSESIRRGIREKLLRGQFPCKAPIGYLNEPRLRTIVVDEAKAPLVRRMFEECATDSMSLPKLRDLAASWGLRGPKGNPLALSKMTFLLSNPFYIGLFRFKGELYEGKHEPIIPRDLFDRVQAVLKRRTKVVSKKQKEIAYLGLLRCGECGCAITAERQKGHHYYRCTKKKGPCSEPFFIREEALTNQLRQSLYRVSLPDGETEMMLAQVNKWRMAETAEATSAIRRYKDSIAEVDTRIQRLTDLCVDGLISKEEFAARKEPLLHEKSALREKMAAIQGKDRPWIELLENFIHDANQAGKAAFSETLSDLRDFHKKIGSNLVWSGPVSPTRREPEQRPSKERAIRQAHGEPGMNVPPHGDITIAPRPRAASPRGRGAKNPSEIWTSFDFLPHWRPQAPGSPCPSESFRNIRRKPVPILNVQFPGPWLILARSSFAQGASEDKRAKNQKWWTLWDSNPRPDD